MNENTKLELAKEIMIAMIGNQCKDGFNENDKKLIKLLEEEQEMNNFNFEVINKIIKVYGPIVRGGKR